MGIEPTRDPCEPHTGFEDQEHHQAPVTSASCLLRFIVPQHLADQREQPQGSTRFVDRKGDFLKEVGQASSLASRIIHIDC